MTTIQILALSAVAIAIVILLALIALESIRNVMLLGQDFGRDAE